MPGRLFMLAVSTMGLRFCENDANRMTSCLSCKYGYELVRPEPKYGAVLEGFANFVDDCSKLDTAILYFSGHGVAAGGRLFFPLSDDPSRRANLIDLNHILLNFEDCHAQNRLVILDCCHADESAKYDWSIARSNRYLILAASKFMQTAKEVEELNGGLMTSKLADLLECPPSHCVDKGGQTLVHPIYHELRRQIDQYRKFKPDEEIYLPSLIGDNSDFPLGKAPLTRSAVVLSAIAKNPRLGVEELSRHCPTLAPNEVQETVQQLKIDRLVTDFLGIIVISDLGRERLKVTASP